MLSKKSASCLLAVVFSLNLISGGLSAADSVTEYQYDSRGRLIQAKNDVGKKINYHYDDAGNRVSVTDGVVAPVLDPVITSFSAPKNVTFSGASALVSWVSENASSCALAIFDDSSSYPSMPTTGSQTIRIYQDTAVTVTCTNGTQSASAGRTIRLIDLN